MKIPKASGALKACLLVVTLLISSARPGAAVLWEAFNDYRPTDGVTSPNASTYDLRITDDGGVLRNIATGADLNASVIVSLEGDVDPDNFGANSPVNAESPADKLFKGKVDIGNEGLPGIRNSAGTKLILNFQGLDPSKRYNFRGTVSRGGNYNDRWSVFTITGADLFVAAHEDGSANKNIFTKATFSQGVLEPNQVALNSGDNKAGSLVGWDNIEPGPDGGFEIAAQQYVGPAPFGNPSAAAYAYGFTAIYLAEIESTGALRITENPASQNLPAGRTATFTVVAASPQPITYQWQKAASGSATFADIPGATSASYTTPALTVADDGSKFQAVVSSGASRATSGEATLRVDGTVPTLTAVRGSVNFNAVHVTFSEPMNLVSLATAANYQVSGGVTVSSAVALDPANARLLTSAQTAGTRYTLTVNNVEDVAGNKIAANSARGFNGFSVQPGTVGLEIWNIISGGGVQDLRNSARYPSEPDVDYVTTTLNSELIIPNGPNNTYGGRFRAWLTPEESGDYEFFLHCDDTGEFRISMNDRFDDLDSPDLFPDVVDSSAGDGFQEWFDGGPTSLPISLVRGTKYAVQMIWKEGNGNDYGQVAWRKVGDATPADQLVPIPSKFFSYYGPGPEPASPAQINRIALQAGSVVLEWTGATLQSSTDLKSWADETGAVSPLSITPVGQKFYRVRN